MLGLQSLQKHESSVGIRDVRRGFSVSDALLCCVSGEASETWGAECRSSGQGEDRLFLLAGESVQHQRERDVSADDRGAGQLQGVAGGCHVIGATCGSW